MSTRTSSEGYIVVREPATKVAYKYIVECEVPTLLGAKRKANMIRKLLDYRKIYVIEKLDVMGYKRGKLLYNAGEVNPIYSVYTLV